MQSCTSNKSKLEFCPGCLESIPDGSEFVLWEGNSEVISSLKNKLIRALNANIDHD
jgi:hypothetical protein